MIFRHSHFAQFVSDTELPVQLHAAAVGDVHLGVRGGRRIAFDEQRLHTVSRQGERQRKADRPTAGDQYRDPVNRCILDHR
nr:hypothetical protein [Mycolicibacterium llatzerense]